MKRVCKNVDVTDAALIEEAVLECLRPAKKRQRADTARLFARVLGISRRKAGAVLRERGALYMTAVRKIGEYQVSSIPGRGAAYGKRAIERWLRDGGGKYAVKMDVRDFYGSIKRPVLMKWLHRHVKNRQLLWLVGQLVYSAPEGIPIGSFLSQTLANIYLSDLYHLAMEGCTSKRGRHQVAHAIFYMDDMLLLGSNKRQLASYHGYMQGVACQSFAAGADAWRVFTIAFTSTDYGKSKIHTRAGAGHS